MASAITFSDGTVISRFADRGTGLVGVWSTDPTNWYAATFAFFPNGRVLSIHPYAETVGACATARQGPPGVEHAPYSFNASNGALAIGPRTVDSSGCTGLWDIGDAAGAIFNTTVRRRRRESNSRPHARHRLIPIAFSHGLDPKRPVSPSFSTGHRQHR